MTLENLCKFLGSEFSVKKIDNGPSLRRMLNDAYEIEIFKAGSYNLCVWKTNPVVQVCIYNGISDPQTLKI